MVHDKDVRDQNVFTHNPTDNIEIARVFRNKSMKARIRTAGTLHHYKDRAQVDLKKQLTAYFKKDKILSLAHRRSSIAMIQQNARGLTDQKHFKHAFGKNFLQFLADHPKI